MLRKTALPFSRICNLKWRILVQELEIAPLLNSSKHVQTYKCVTNSLLLLFVKTQLKGIEYHFWGNKTTNFTKASTLRIWSIYEI